MPRHTVEPWRLSHVGVFTLEEKHTGSTHTHTHTHAHTHTHTHTHILHTLTHCSANRSDVQAPCCHLKVTIQHCFSHRCFISSSSSSSLSVHLCLLLLFPCISLSHCQATHPNMRTYYFCTDTAKEMESWMKVMTDAALVHSEPTRRSVLLKGTHPHRYQGCNWNLRHSHHSLLHIIQKDCLHTTWSHLSAQWTISINIYNNIHTCLDKLGCVKEIFFGGGKWPSPNAPAHTSHIQRINTRMGK